jgi:hypothetical protein
MDSTVLVQVLEVFLSKSPGLFGSGHVTRYTPSVVSGANNHRYALIPTKGHITQELVLGR